MGMSASQARLIQLTARMSDVEYEGQQINQQRLALSNKMSDIYSQMEGMIVPTPPSPYDHMVTSYEGKDANGNAVEVIPNQDGTFDVATDTPGTTLLPTANKFEAGKTDKYNEVASEEIPAPSGNNVIKAKYKAEELYTGKTVNDKHMTMDEFNELVQKKEKALNNFKTEEPKQEDYQKDVFNDEGVKTGTEDDTVAYNTAHQKWQEKYTTGQNELNAIKSSPNHSWWDFAQPEKMIETDSTKAPEKYHAHGINANPNSEGATIQYTFTNVLGKETKGDANALKTAANGYSQDEIKSIKEKYFANEKGAALTDDAFNAATGKLNAGVKLYEKSQVDTIGGSELLSFADAETKASQDMDFAGLWADAKVALQNYVNGMGEASNITAADVDNAGISIAYDKNGIRFFKKLDGTSDSGNSKYQELNVGKGTVKDVVKGGTGDFSLAGSLKGVTLPDGSTVTAKKVETLDNVSMGAATAEYEAKKAEYDKEQDRLNNETSKIQLEDKKLDLKLKRLDTERNALNTEIDAVKKVIQDSVDKGFKTFSG